MMPKKTFSDLAMERIAKIDNLAAALRRAKDAHTEFEKHTGVPDPDWPGWYAQFIVDNGMV